MHKNIIYFLRRFSKPVRPYVFVYFNNKADYDVYGQLRSMFFLLALDHFQFLSAFYVVKPSIYHRAFDYFAYATMPKYLKSKTIYQNTVKDFC